MARRCAHCGTKVGEKQRLCTTCHMGIDKYPDQNQVIIDAYLAAGLLELGDYLERRNAFTTWLINHGGTP